MPGKPARTERIDRQALFIEHYLQCRNGAEAARRAGYKTKSNVKAAQLLAKDSIRAVIAERMKALQMETDEILIRLTEQARGNLGDFLAIRNGLGFIDLDKAAKANKLHLLKSFNIEKGGVKIELYDAQGALKTLAQIHGLLRNGTTVNLNINVELVTQVVERLQSAGFDPARVFNDMLAELEAHARQSDPNTQVSETRTAE
jgi:hypothetical protein